jgi:hypothetical protein
MKKHHEIGNIRFADGNLLITIDGREKSFSLNQVSPILEKASDDKRCLFEVSPSGYGIHWPLLDEDISIDGLLGIRHSPSQRKQTP